MQELLK